MKWAQIEMREEKRKEVLRKRYYTTGNSACGDLDPVAMVWHIESDVAFVIVTSAGDGGLRF